jgi:hypothetical protein
MSSSDPTLRELRAQFGSSRFIAMPIAGMIAWAVAGVLGSQLRPGAASIALFICTGMIFPLGILIARFVGEDVLKTKNELDRLFGMNVMMASLSWAIVIPFWLKDPTSLPLGVGVLAGTMWIPFSWMLQHWVGLFHGVTRTVLLVVAHFAFPANRFVVIPAIIVVIYLITIVVLLKRPRPLPPEPNRA